MVYPYYVDDKTLRKKLIDNRNRKVSEKVLFRTRKIGIIVQKKQAFFF